MTVSCTTSLAPASVSPDLTAASSRVLAAEAFELGRVEVVERLGSLVVNEDKSPGAA